MGFRFSGTAAHDNNNWLFNNSAADVTVTPFTVAMWIKADSTGSAETFTSFPRQDTEQSYHALQMNSSGNLLCTSSVTDSIASSASAGALTGGAWDHCCGVWASITSRTAYLNGVAATTNTTSKNPTVNYTTIGTLKNGGSFQQDLFGGGAEYCVWNIALSAAEITALSNGLHPLCVRPTNIVSYRQFGEPIEIVGSSYKAIVGEQVMTDNGTVEVDDHPPIAYSSAQILQFPSAGGEPPAAAILALLQQSNLGADLYNGTLQ